MTLSSGTVVRIVDAEGVREKLLAASPRILAENRAMLTQMLEMVKTEIEPDSPAYLPGPRGGGVHVEASSSGVKTTGSLLAAPKGYWREFGTRGRFRGASASVRGYIASLVRQGASVGGGGEAAGLYAVHALAGVRKFINFYYGKAQWWRL